MHEIENDEETLIFSRPLTAQQRVSKYRANNQAIGIKTVEIKLNRDEIAVLDAIASNKGMSRVLLASEVLKIAIRESGYFISGGRLITPTNYPSGSF